MLSTNCQCDRVSSFGRIWLHFDESNVWWISVHRLAILPLYICPPFFEGKCPNREEGQGAYHHGRGKKNTFAYCSSHDWDQCELLLLLLRMLLTVFFGFLLMMTVTCCTERTSRRPLGFRYKWKDRERESNDISRLYSLPFHLRVNVSFVYPSPSPLSPPSHVPNIDGGILVEMFDIPGWDVMITSYLENIITPATYPFVD